MLIGNGYHNVQKERRAIEQLIRHRCAALVVHAKMIPDEELAGLMKQIPGMVLINRILPGYETRCVALDDRYGARLATRHLISRGTRVSAICAQTTISLMRKIACRGTTRRWRRAACRATTGWSRLPSRMKAAANRR